MFRLSGVSGRLAPVLARAFIVLAVLVAFSWITMAAEPNQDQPKQAEKAPVPYDKDLARAEAVVRAQYRAECDKLALKLLQEGLAQKDPKRRFVLLRRARDLAIHAGNLDTAWAACRDHEHHPLTGKRCALSFLDCFHCANCLITHAHLPGLLSLLDALETRRPQMSGDGWWTRYGPAWAAIRFEVLPKFSRAELDHASSVKPQDSLLDLVEPRWEHP